MKFSAAYNIGAWVAACILTGCSSAPVAHRDHGPSISCREFIVDEEHARSYLNKTGASIGAFIGAPAREVEIRGGRVHDYQGQHFRVGAHILEVASEADRARLQRQRPDTDVVCIEYPGALPAVRNSRPCLTQ